MMSKIEFRQTMKKRKWPTHQVAFFFYRDVFRMNNSGDEEKPQIFYLNCWDPSHEEREPSKNWSMLLVAAGTRYSLVKGERIVRSVTTAQLLALCRPLLTMLNSSARCCHSLPQAVWD